jgi:soluble lytic murein transglycosylase-like protein
MGRYWVEDVEVIEYEYEQAPPEQISGGCLFGLLSPISVILVSCMLAFFAANLTSPATALSVNLSTDQIVDVEVSEQTQEINLEQEMHSQSVLSPVFTKEVLYWEEKIVHWASQWGIDPNLVATVMQIESCGDPRAVSRAGAAGLFQVMPYHFATGEDPLHPGTNAKRGLAYLARALAARDNDARLALASYNGGITGASRPESQWANETKRYADWGSGIYEDATSGKKNSPHLEEWLGAGGASLCRQASNRLDLTP